MASTQRPARRRSARIAFDEEDARPTKKAKTGEEANGVPAKSTNGRKIAGKKNKAAYDEDADGFQFSRTRSRKVVSKETAPDSTLEPSDPARPATGWRKKTAPDEARQEEEPTTKRRRSARLSTENEQTLTGKTPSRRKDDTSRTDVRHDTQTPAASVLVVEKARGPTKIALPFADTPVITRNKEMRKNSAQGHRRSSSGMRGRRASSLIDSGTSNAMPHAEVATSDFYKHISQDLPEPRRMQQLLSWCATRALPEKPSGSSDDVNAVLAARVIQEELLKDFSKRSDMSDWFNREDIAPAALIKKPNPRNIQNAAKLQELEREVKRLEDETQAWDKVLASLSKSADQQHALPDGSSQGADATNAALLGSPEQAAILSTLSSQKGLSGTTATRLQQTTDSLEFKIDDLADGVHKVEKLKETTDSVVDAILGNAASVLESRDKAALEKTGMQKVGIGDVLRSLSRAL